jgi:hypothetical protein
MSSGMEPVVIQHWRDHEFVGPKKKGARCGARDCCHPLLPAVHSTKRTALQHLGHPQSMNVDSGVDYHGWEEQKGWWQVVLGKLIGESGLPYDLERVSAEMLFVFPTHHKRDQWNIAGPFVKYLGDTLVEGGWLKDDRWDRYEAGYPQAAYLKDQSGVLVMLMPDDQPVPRVWPPAFDMAPLASWATVDVPDPLFAPSGP